MLSSMSRSRGPIAPILLLLPLHIPMSTPIQQSSPPPRGGKVERDMVAACFMSDSSCVCPPPICKPLVCTLLLSCSFESLSSSSSQESSVLLLLLLMGDDTERGESISVIVLRLLRLEWLRGRLRGELRGEFCALIACRLLAACFRGFWSNEDDRWRFLDVRLLWPVVLLAPERAVAPAPAAAATAASSGRACRRLSVAFQRFFTALSVLPGKSRAILAQLFPHFRRLVTIIVSSSALKGPFRTSGFSWLCHLSRHCFDTLPESLAAM